MSGLNPGPVKTILLGQSKKIFDMIEVLKSLNDVGLMLSIICTSLPRQSVKREVLVSRWSTKTHTFITSWEN